MGGGHLPQDWGMRLLNQRGVMMKAAFFLLAFLISSKGAPLLSAQEKPRWQMEWDREGQLTSKRH